LRTECASHLQEKTKNEKRVDFAERL